MRLDELVNENYNKLNENDLLIWQYIQNHKKECCSISIEELAGKCSISRTTISRFTQKLAFEGFRELKIYLKLEYEVEKQQKDILLDDVCLNYVKCIHTARDMDMQEICEHIYKAKRLFVFGTGEVQNSTAQMIKRMFMCTKRFFVALAGKSELIMALEDLESEDFMIIISLSGETELAVQAAKTECQMRIGGICYLCDIQLFPYSSSAILGTIIWRRLCGGLSFCRGMAQGTGRNLHAAGFLQSQWHTGSGTICVM